jgi:hypothetical protein
MDGWFVSSCGVGWPAQLAVVDRSRKVEGTLDLAELRRYVGIIGA